MTESILRNVAGSMALSGMDLSEQDMERIRRLVNDPDCVEEIVMQLIDKHKQMQEDT